MPTEIDLDRPPAGHVLRAARDGENTLVQFLEFTSTEDGQHFIQRLEGFPDEILRKLSPPLRPSQVESLLAIIRPDGGATVYVNELQMRALVRASGRIEKGAVVTKNDIADIERLELDVRVPNDTGFLFLFSVGWRKGLFYDYGPLGGSNPKPREYDVFAALGQAFCHVLFQERFSISDAEWDGLFAAKWFPFVGLRHERIDALINHVRAGWDPDEMLDEIVGDVQGRAPQMLESWRGVPSFAPHLDILSRAVERFRSEDWVSCTGLIFPRIEGILRSHHTSLGTTVGASPDNLTRSAVAARISARSCLLLPHRFASYLQTVYFANFNPVAQNIEVSRHSVAHGVASASEFNRKSALIGLLVVHQLFYFMGTGPADCDQWIKNAQERQVPTPN